MFLIAGVSPKTKILDQNPRPCPACGLTRAYHQRIDHYFSLFFLPLFRVKRGEPFIICERCKGAVGGRFEDGYHRPEDQQGRQCDRCGKILQGDFKYCPYCGKPL